VRAVVGILLSLCLCGPAHGSRDQALLIGISQYTELNSLRYADSDVVALSQLLTEFGGYPKADVTVVLNQEATKARIVEAIDKIVRTSAKDPLDHFILMFAGHGVPGRIDNKNTNIFLAPSDASTAENTFYSTGSEVVNETFISRAWLARQLSLINAKSIVIILDSCYSGTKAFGALFLENLGYTAQAFGDGSGREVTVVRKRNAVFASRKVAYLASAREDQQAAEYDELRHGALSYCIFEYVKRARRETYDDERKELTVDGVYANITALFHEVKVNGRALDEVHQPILLPIPDLKSIQGMEFLIIQGTKKHESKPEVKGLLDIKAERPGAEISVDGFKQEPLPGPLEIPEGKHLIEVFVPDTNYSYTFTAAISAAQPVQEVVAMYGTLEVESFWLQDGRKTAGPPLDVYINGKHVGKSQLRLDNLEAGTHLLEVRYLDVSKQRQIEIRPNSPLRVNFSVVREAEPKKPDDKGVGNVVF
jgi:hypothetical protein